MPRCVVKFGINRQLIREAKRDGLQVAVREALWRAALWWFKTILPDHFEPSAPSKYAGDYTPRTRIYMLRKAGALKNSKGGYKTKKGRRRAHQRPMYWTGTMRRTILKGQPEREGFKSAGSVRVRLRLPYASAANLWAGKQRVKSTGEVHNFHRELAAMTDQQRGVIAKRVERTLRWIRGRKYATAGLSTERFAA